jgi:hypothetical protein
MTQDEASFLWKVLDLILWKGFLFLSTSPRFIRDPQGPFLKVGFAKEYHFWSQAWERQTRGDEWVLLVYKGTASRGGQGDWSFPEHFDSNIEEVLFSITGIGSMQCLRLGMRLNELRQLNRASNTNYNW